MSTTTAYMGLTLPALNGDPGVWDTGINASLALIDTHRHVPGEGVQVPSAGININAALTFAGFAATNLAGTRFTTQASRPGTNAVWVKTSDGELYFTNSLSQDAKLTSGGQVNIAAVGGIVGDYAAASAAFYYDDATETYLALQAAPGPNVWAALASGDIDLYEKASGIANRVRLSSPNTLAASYKVTFPAAVPGSTAIVSMAATGDLTASNTIANAVTMSALTTFSAGATGANNQHFTVQGTGRYKHGTLTKNVNAQAGYGSWGTGSGYVVSLASSTWYLAVPFDEGERLISFSFRRFGDGAVDLTYEVNAYDTSGVKTTLATATVNNVGAAWATESAGSSHTFASGSCLVLEFAANAANCQIGNVSLSYDRP